MSTAAVAPAAGPLWALFIDQAPAQAAAPATSGDNRLPGGTKALDSMRAMQRVIEDEAQRASYREFLRGLAEDGNSLALEVLRSESAAAITFSTSTQNGFSGDDNAAIALKHELQHAVAKNGDVTYSFHGKEILRDLGTTVLVIDKTDAGLLMGLRLAQAKFGQAISMHGDAHFVERNCIVAAKNGLDISFKDPAHQAMLDGHRESIKRQVQARADRARITLPSDASLPERPLGAKLHGLGEHVVAVLDQRTADRRLDEASAALVAALARKAHYEKTGEMLGDDLPLAPRSGAQLSRRPLAGGVGSGSATPPARKTYRHQMLETTYGQSSENLAKYWRVDKSRQGVVFSNKEGRIVDRGVSIHCDRGNANEIDAMIEVAKIKGWKSLTMLSGSDDFKYSAMTASLRAGLDIVATTAADKTILEKVKKDLAGAGGKGGSEIGGIAGGGTNAAADDAATALALRMSTLLGGEDRRKEARRADKKFSPK